MLAALCFVAAAVACTAVEVAVSEDAEQYSLYSIDDAAITVGTNHACVLNQDHAAEIGGKVVCWGANDHGQLNATSVRNHRHFMLVLQLKCR
jgi:alpha-tubulin suppressor-like RCC1 family protein